MILEQLMEKKDLFIYIDLRIQELQHLSKNLEDFPERFREKQYNKMDARITELKRLKNHVKNNRLKDICKDKWWREHV